MPLFKTTFLEAINYVAHFDLDLIINANDTAYYLKDDLDTIKATYPSQHIPPPPNNPIIYDLNAFLNGGEVPHEPRDNNANHDEQPHDNHDSSSSSSDDDDENNEEAKEEVKIDQPPPLVQAPQPNPAPQPVQPVPQPPAPVPIPPAPVNVPDNLNPQSIAANPNLLNQADKVCKPKVNKKKSEEDKNLEQFPELPKPKPKSSVDSKKEKRKTKAEKRRPRNNSIEEVKLVKANEAKTPNDFDPTYSI